MTVPQLNKLLGNIDLYLLDQILKNNIPDNAKILDAGCGEGRNLIYFLNTGFDVAGLDQNPDAIKMLQFIIGSNYPHYSKENFIVGELSSMPYRDESFDYIICSAVLHFARSEQHFMAMMDELYRVMKPDGQLFIRMTSDIGLVGHKKMANDLFHLPDGSIRFLITEEMISSLLARYNLGTIGPIKTVVVDGMRCMTTLILQKK